MTKKPTDTPGQGVKTDKRVKYDAAFRAEALRLARQSRSVPAAARALNIRPRLLYAWQKAELTPAAVAAGPTLDPATATELRELRVLNRRQAQELEILEKAIANCSTPTDRMSQYRFSEAQRPHYAVRLLCQVLAVTPSRYYGWRAAQPAARQPPGKGLTQNVPPA